MNKIAAALLLAVGMANAQAVPIVFTNSTYTTFALADVGGMTDGPDTAVATVPPDTLPINSSAMVTALGGSAQTNAIADSLSVAANAAASSAGGLSSANAVTTFLGAFTTPGGQLSLSVDFKDTTLMGGTGLASSTLAVSLVVDGLSLFDQSFSSTQLINNSFLVPAGLLGQLEITLASSATSSVDDDTASNLATASFTAQTVPEPATLALVLGGLSLLGLGRRFGGRAAIRYHT